MIQSDLLIPKRWRSPTTFDFGSQFCTIPKKVTSRIARLVFVWIRNQGETTQLPPVRQFGTLAFLRPALHRTSAEVFKHFGSSWGLFWHLSLPELLYVVIIYLIFVHSFFWHRLNIVLKYWILSTSQRNVPTPTKNLRMDCAFEMTRSHPGILAQGLAFSAQQKSQVLSGVPNHGRCMFRSPAVGVRPWQIWGAVALRHWVRCSPVTSEWDTGKRCCRFWSWCLKDRDDWLRLLIGGLMIMVNWLTA